MMDVLSPISRKTSNKDADGCGWIREHSYRKVAWNGCMEDMGRQDDMSCLQYPGYKVIECVHNLYYVQIECM